MGAHAVHAGRDIIESVTQAFLQPLFYFWMMHFSIFCFYLIEYLTPIRGKKVLL